jgi:hypothetical protein
LSTGTSQPDCVALQKTVTTQAPVITITSFKTLTVPASTTTVLQFTTATLSITEVSDVPYTSVDVVTSISSGTVFSQKIITNLQTSIISYTQSVPTPSTITTYFFTPKPTPSLGARDDESSDAQMDADVSACSGEAQVTTMTISASITTTVSTIHSTSPVITLSQISHIFLNATTAVTSSHQVNATITSIIQATVTSVLDPTTIDITVVQTSTVTVTTTSTVSGPTMWCQMNLKASGGALDGRYMSSLEFPRYGAIVISSVGSQLKNTYRLDSNGHVHPLDGFAGGWTWSNYDSHSIEIQPGGSLAISAWQPHVCQVDSITLEVTCQWSATSEQNNVWMDGSVTKQGPYLWLGPDVPAGSTVFRLYAEPVDCVT